MRLRIRRRVEAHLSRGRDINLLYPFGFPAIIAHLKESLMSLRWPIHGKTLRTFISILCVALALAPVPFIAQKRSSEVVLPTSKPCDRSVQQRMALVIGNGAYSICLLYTSDAADERSSVD